MTLSRLGLRYRDVEVKLTFILNDFGHLDWPQREVTNCKGKGKVHTTTGHEDPEGEQRYSSTLYLTSAVDEGGCSAPRSGRFTSGKDPVPIV